MTYDERQEIETYIAILRKDVQRMNRGIDLLEAVLNKIPCVIKEDEKVESAKENFLKQY